MSHHAEFKRWYVPGATYFFTLVTYKRRPLFRDPAARRCLRSAIAQTRAVKPFDILAFALLPDHLHCIWTLPGDDADFSTRWRRIKERFTRCWLSIGGNEQHVTPGQRRKGLRGVWQPRFWEHVVRDEADFGRLLDYIHYNPVKHELAACAHAWEWSSFGRWVRAGNYDADWCCACHGANARKLDWSAVQGHVGE